MAALGGYRVWRRSAVRRNQEELAAKPAKTKAWRMSCRVNRDMATAPLCAKPSDGGRGLLHTSLRHNFLAASVTIARGVATGERIVSRGIVGTLYGCALRYVEKACRCSRYHREGWYARRRVVIINRAACFIGISAVWRVLVSASQRGAPSRRIANRISLGAAFSWRGGSMCLAMLAL